MNGYTQIEINGQTVGLKFAFPAIRWFMEESVTKSDLYFIDGDNGGFTVEGLAKLVQCSYKNNCLLKEVEPSLTYEDFYNWVEQAQQTEEGKAELIRVSEVYAQSTVMKKIIEGQKKSQMSSLQTSTISNRSAMES